MEHSPAPQPTRQERRERQRQERRAGRQRRRTTAAWTWGGVGLVAVLAVGAALWGRGRPPSQSPPADEGTPILSAISASDHVKGNRDARVVLIEYSDFQCPACGAYYPVTKQLVEEFGADMAFVYRHFPLRQVHEHADLAARAAEAAGKQDTFWDMHDVIFERQEEWSNERNAEELFLRYADELGLNVEQLRNDMDSKEVRGKVTADARSGARAGVNATPTFFLNGEKLQHPRTVEAFASLIREAVSQHE